MSVKEIELVIDQLPQEDWAELESWLELRRAQSKSFSDEIVGLYSDSLASNGELTASSSVQEDLHVYSFEELAAMEAGEFERPMR